MFTAFALKVVGLLICMALVIGGIVWLAQPPLYVMSASLREQSRTIPSSIGNTTTFMDYGGNPDVFAGYPLDYFKTTEPQMQYAQIVSAAGGNDRKDPFVDPQNLDVLDDYDFSKLIAVCRSCVSHGIKPYLKLGSVPRKLSDGYEIRDFNTNVCPPKDYNQWRIFIKALTQALVDEFGRSEVRSWRFGTVSEYNNYDWFRAGPIDWNNVTDPALEPVKQATEVAVMKLYDYTVDALQQVLGEDIDVGVHLMHWGKNSGISLLEHCAKGTNYATGKPGTRITFAATSDYIGAPGGKTDTLDPSPYIRDSAKSFGLNLYYGIDEGYVLGGTNEKPLNTRTVGATWQAGMMARKLHVAIEGDNQYASFWNSGRHDLLPVVTQTTILFSRLGGHKQLPVTTWLQPWLINSQHTTKALVGYDATSQTLRVLLYASADDPNLQGKVRAQLFLSDLPVPSGKLKATRTLISDNSNYYDDLLRDVRADNTLEDKIQPPDAWGSYEDIYGLDKFINTPERKEKYQKASELTPTQETLDVWNGVLSLNTTLQSHNVVLYEIDLK